MNHTAIAMDAGSAHPVKDRNKDGKSKPLTARDIAWRTLGLVSVSIGLINAVIPLLPTTVFLLIGVWAFGKSAPQWQARMLAHPRYGPTLSHWQNGRQMTAQGKRIATLGISASALFTLAVVGVSPVSMGVAAGLLALTAWLWRRPEPATTHIA